MTAPEVPVARAGTGASYGRIDWATRSKAFRVTIYRESRDVPLSFHPTYEEAADALRDYVDTTKEGR